LEIYEAEEVFAVFVFTFITYNYIYDESPLYDLDMASYGIVKSLRNRENGYKGLPWKPKQSFFEVSNYYAGH
jgi:hypothetical protein